MIDQLLQLGVTNSNLIKKEGKRKKREFYITFIALVYAIELNYSHMANS
jgi:hypothetical protein